MWKKIDWGLLLKAIFSRERPEEIECEKERKAKGPVIVMKWPRQIIDGLKEIQRKKMEEADRIHLREQVRKICQRNMINISTQKLRR